MSRGLSKHNNLRDWNSQRTKQKNYRRNIKVQRILRVKRPELPIAEENIKLRDTLLNILKFIE